MAGNKGSSSYSGTCSFMDAFCTWRAQQGLAATTIDLPAVAGIGYLAKHQDQAELLRGMYGEGLDEISFLAIMKAAIKGKISPSAENNCQSIIGNFYTAISASQPFVRDPRFSFGRRMNLGAEAASNSVNEANISVRHQLQAATTYTAAYSAVYDGVARKISSMMLLAMEDITPKKSIASYGLDSLVIVEFRNWLRRELDAILNMIELMNCASLERLVKDILAKSKLIKAELVKEVVAEAS